MKTVDILSFVQDMTAESGRFIQSYFRNTDLVVESKSDATPVTLADQGAEKLLRERIQAQFPDHGIRGEEFPDHNPDAEYTWILDPIDGTKAFITGVHLFGTLIGLLHKGQPIFGAIHHPALNILCTGDNEQAWINGTPIQARTTSILAEATFVTGDARVLPETPSPQGWKQLIEKARLFRTWGDCYGYHLVAAGLADIMIDAVVAPWDILPVIPIIRGAGAVVTDWQGNDPVVGKSAIAATRELHPQVIELLNGS